jgi:hypothetical protein
MFDGSLGAVSPLLEMGAYEALWARADTSFKTLAERFRSVTGAMPSSFVDADEGKRFAQETLALPWVVSSQHGPGRRPWTVQGTFATHEEAEAYVASYRAASLGLRDDSPILKNARPIEWRICTRAEAETERHGLITKRP